MVVHLQQEQEGNFMAIQGGQDGDAHNQEPP